MSENKDNSIVFNNPMSKMIEQARNSGVMGVISGISTSGTNLNLNCDGYSIKTGDKDVYYDGIMPKKTEFVVAAHGLIIKNNQILITQRSKAEEYMPLKWDIPGGTMNPNETAEQALEREIFEETGMTVKVLCPIHVYTNLATLPDKQYIQIVYLCQHFSGDVKLDPNEHIDFTWVDYKQIYLYDLIPFVKDLYHKVKECDLVKYYR